MTIKQFQDHLLGLAQGAIYARTTLQNIVELELDTQDRDEYKLDIETIILDLNNVMRDCAFLLRLIRTNERID